MYRNEVEVVSPVRFRNLNDFIRGNGANSYQLKSGPTSYRRSILVYNSNKIERSYQHVV